jgi:hypothetical protein
MAKANEAINLIRQHFSFLFDDGFVVIYSEDPKAFGNWLVILRSGKFTVKFREDRGQVMLACGPLTAPVGWDHHQYCDLEILIGFLKNDPKVDFREPFPYDLSAQLERLAKKMIPYYDKITEFCQSDIFSAHQKDLEIYWKKVTNDYLEAFKPVKPKKK